MRKTVKGSEGGAVTGAGRVSNRSASRARPVDLMTLTDLQQVRVLADPLRVRILEALGTERTTRQVAAEIGENPTKLYHHVDALERVGLIRLTRTRRKRGTLERYYRVVALCFRTDSRLFPRLGGTEPVIDVVSNLLGRVGDELRDLAAGCGGAGDLEKQAILSFVEVRAPEAEILALRRKLERLLKDLLKLAGAEGGGREGPRYRLLLGYYPIPKRTEG
jgi:DNA-binding transcriptional ArsR family regulator